MNRLCCALIASLVLLAFSAPAWAQGTSHGKQQWAEKNDTHYGHHIYKSDKHKMKVLKQFRQLKKRYNRSLEDARQMFLDFAIPCANSATEGSDDTAYGHSAYRADRHMMAVLKQFRHLKRKYNRSIEDARQMFLESLPTPETCTNGDTEEPGDTQDSEDPGTGTTEDPGTGTTEDPGTGTTEDPGTGTTEDPGTGTAGEPQLVSSWSTDIYSPYALDVDGAGNIFTVEKDYKSVVGYDNAGAQIAQWTSATLSMPVDLALDSQGNVYILDENAAQPLQKYTQDGNPLAFAASSTPIFYPMGLFIDSQDTIYVTDLGGASGSRILKFDTSGNYLATLGEVSELEFAEYRDIAVDEQNQIIYLVTRFGNMVAKLDMDGNFLGSWNGSLRSPNGIAVGTQGQVFVADTYNNEIDQYDADGNLMYSFGTNELYKPNRIVMDNAGKLYLADESNQLIRIYQ